jgi:hypothetical protein
MQIVRFENLLPEDFPKRRDVEGAARAAFDRLDGPPCEVTLRRGPSDAGPDSIAVEVRAGAKPLAFACVYPRDRAADIAERLKLFKLRQ